MESLSSQSVKRRCGAVAEQRRLGLEPESINRIAEQRMTDRGHMDPNLMRPACLELAGDQACRPERFLESASAS